MFSPIIIRKSQLDDTGSLNKNRIDDIKNILENGGVVLLPSDTCYSLAALPNDIEMRRKVNTILNREDIPFSLAFPNLKTVEKFVNIDKTLRILFQNFTPGYITIICDAKDKSFADKTRSQDGTIGVRITQSIIERTIAGCTSFPITTVPPKYNERAALKFELAFQIVETGLNKLSKPIPWAAIESDDLELEASTVVGLNHDGSLRVIREGAISSLDIHSKLQQ